VIGARDGGCRFAGGAVCLGCGVSGELSWRKQVPGSGFGPKQIISTSADYVTGCACIDIDGDGDVDVLSASPHDDKVALYENLGGGSFGSPIILTTNADYAVAVIAVDIDGDGPRATANSGLSLGYKTFKVRLGPPEPHSATIAPRRHPVNRPVAQPASRA